MAGRSDNNPSQQPLTFFIKSLKINAEGKNSIGIEYNVPSGVNLDSLPTFADNAEVSMKGENSKGVVANIQEQPANNQNRAQPAGTQVGGITCSSDDGRPSSNVQGYSGNEQIPNLQIGSAADVPESRNSATNAGSGDTKQMESKRNLNDGSSNKNKTLQEEAISGENATVSQSTKEGQNGAQDTGIGRMSSEFKDSNHHGRASPVAGDGRKSRNLGKSEEKKMNEAPRVGAPSLEDTKDLCGLVGKIEVIPYDRNDYERSLTDKRIYRITKPKGVALILNNTFEGTREGSEIDVENMTTLWDKFGCRLYGNENYPRPWESDKTGEEMKKLLREVSEVKTKYSFIVIVIMTHGGNDNGKLVFKGSDYKSVEVKEIEEMFFNTKNGNLHNIPKFFIFQFCRGTINDRGTIAADNERIETGMQSFGKVSVQTDGAERLPTSSDTIVAYATHEEHAALRNTRAGSWFINAITNVFMRQAAKNHVVDMLTTVNRAMKEKTALYSEKDKDGNVIDRYEVKAMSKQETSLSRRFYLFPGFPE